MSVEVDQSIDKASPVFDLIERSPFYIRSIYAVPVAWTKQSTLKFSLGGGSARELNDLLDALKRLPAVLSTDHTPMPV